MIGEEAKKYLIRFAPLIVIFLALIFILKPGNILVVGYKLSLIMVGAFTAEFLWILFFKRVLGALEDMGATKYLGTCILRGLWDGSIILALTLGL